MEPTQDYCKNINNNLVYKNDKNSSTSRLKSNIVMSEQGLLSYQNRVFWPAIDEQLTKMEAIQFTYDLRCVRECFVARSVLYTPLDLEGCCNHVLS